MIIWHSTVLHMLLQISSFSASKGPDLHNPSSYGKLISSSETELVPGYLQVKRLSMNRASSWPGAVSVCLNTCTFHQCSSTEATLCCKLQKCRAFGIPKTTLQNFKEALLIKPWSVVITDISSATQCWFCRTCHPCDKQQLYLPEEQDMPHDCLESSLDHVKIFITALYKCHYVFLPCWLAAQMRRVALLSHAAVKRKRNWSLAHFLCHFLMGLLRGCLEGGTAWRGETREVDVVSKLEEGRVIAIKLQFIFFHTWHSLRSNIGLSDILKSQHEH